MSMSYDNQIKSDFLSPNSYIDINQYFNDYFKLRKQKSPAFSYEVWSAELGFKSRSYLKMVCSGDRGVTNQFIDLFSKQNNLSFIQESHLVAISMYQRATTNLEKKIHLDKVFETLNPQNPEVQNYIQFLSDYELPLLQLVLGFQDGPQTEEALSDLLNISIENLRDKIFILNRLGLIEEIKNAENIFWKAKHKSFQINDRYLDEALQLYRESTLEEARKYLKLKDIQNKFKTIYIPLEDEKYNEFSEEVDAFMQKLRHKYSSHDLKNRKIFKLNLNSYPVTKKRL